MVLANIGEKFESRKSRKSPKAGRGRRNC